MSARRPAFFGSYGEPFRNSTRWPFASIAKALLLAFAPGTSCSAAANVLKSSSEYLRRLLKIIIFVVNAPFFWFPCCLRGNMKVKGGVLVIDVEKLAHDLAIVSLSQRLAVEYKGKPIDEGQIYGLYKDCFDKVLDQINRGSLDT